jgi:hypothetical protein
MKMAWIATARTELTNNPRLRVGLVVIGALLLLYQLAGLSDLRRGMTADYVAKQVQLARVQGISKEDGWDRRASEIHAMRTALEAEIPDADSMGLAQATMQGWLRDTVTRSGAKLSVTMGAPLQVDKTSAYWKIPAQISGQISSSGALELIRKIESRKELMSVESIRLTTGSQASVSLEVASYYRVHQGGTADAAP